MRDERPSVPRAAHAVEVAGKAYQEVAVVSLPEFECETVYPKPFPAVMAMIGGEALVAVVAALAHVLLRATYGAVP